MNNYTVQIRDRRQITLPKPILEQFGIDIGDSLELKIKNKQVVLKPTKKLALEALKEIQEAFRQSKVIEKKLQNELTKQRLLKNNEK